eukprot:TRINITY_DN14819_c0_g1_i1.p1 TRINITY_DN14819_c0_g1~~TRINITY_DN14819_c0_g1_i1.p1  ORF type:complete len:415 (+),score=98.65 TRINITY_DN14819_c0_g1_i1:352-1596(+)
MLRVALLSALVGLGAAQQPYSTYMTHFGHSIKNGQIKGGEVITVFEHTCVKAPCAVTQIHVPSIYPGSGQPWNWENGILTFTIDGEVLKLTLLELAMEGSDGAKGRNAADGSPWGISMFGKTAKSGAVYSTLRIPFQKTLKVTIEMAPEAQGNGVFWIIIRGVEAYRVTLGDIVLPASTRLRISKFGPQKVTPYQLINLANFTSSGALLTVVFSAESSDYTYLEACMRLVDPAGGVSFLSSGAEDYFLSASYFDEGMFKTENSGLTFFDGRGSVSAYKVHTRDFVPVQGGGSLVFRVGELTSGCGNMTSCPNVFCPKGEQVTLEEPKTNVKMSNNITYTTMVLYYEWDVDGDVETPLETLFLSVDNGYLTAKQAHAVSSKPEAVKTILDVCGKACFQQKDDKKSHLAALMLKDL